MTSSLPLPDNAFAAYCTDGPCAQIMPRVAKGFNAGLHSTKCRVVGKIGIIWGILRGCCELLWDYQDSGQSYVYMDHGYFARGHFKGYYRMTLNAMQQCEVRPCSRDRFERLRLHVKPWRKGGRYIMICPPSSAVLAAYRADHRWLYETTRLVKRFTDRPIKIRHKHSHPSLPRALEDVHCLVTFTSNAAVEAAALGVPVFVTHPCAASPVASSDLSLLDTPHYADNREEWLASLAYGQFTLEEIEKGLACATLFPSMSAMTPASMPLSPLAQGASCVTPPPP